MCFLNSNIRYFFTIWLWASLLLPGLSGAQSARIKPSDSEISFSSKIDSSSIRNLLAKIKNIESRYPDSALLQYRLAYGQSKQIGYNSGMALALNQIGLLLLNNGYYDSALTAFKESAAHMKLSGNLKQLWIPQLNIGNIYFYMAHYELALDNYYRALNIVDRYHLKIPSRDSFSVFSNIALCWGRIGNSKRSEECLKILERIATGQRNPALQVEFYSIAGNILSNFDTHNAITFLFRALAVNSTTISADGRLRIYNNIAHHYLRQGQPDSARYYVDEAFKLLEQYPQSLQYERLHTWDNLGHIYHLEKKYADAEKIWRLVMDKAQQAGNLDMVLHMAPYLADNYATGGRYKAAYKYLREYLQIRDSVINMQKAQSAELWLEAHLAEKNKVVLEQKGQLSQQQSLLRTKNVWIGGSVIGSILLLITLVTLARSYKHRQKLQAATLAQLRNEQEINQLKALVRGEEQERNRIAVELHDGIASELWGIKLNVSSIRELERTGQIRLGRWENIYQQLDDAAQKLRITAHNLMPGLLMDKGLSTALSSLCQRVKKQTGIEVEFQEYGTMGRLNEEIELSLYRMVQELLQNVLKHATGVTSTLVQLSCTNELVNITVEDNGAGFAEETDVVQQGFGLSNIAKRIATLHGHFELKSQKGIGTTAYMEFDLHYLLQK